MIMCLFAAFKAKASAQVFLNVLTLFILSARFAVFYIVKKAIRVHFFFISILFPKSILYLLDFYPNLLDWNRRRVCTWS